MSKPKFKIGQKVVCKPGYSSHVYDSNYAGTGYFTTITESGEDTDYVLIINSTHEAGENAVIYFFENGTDGIYEFGLESLRDRNLEKLFLSLPCDNR